MAKRPRLRRVKSSGAVLTCEQITDLVLDYVAMVLDKGTTVVFEEHIRKCPDCMAFLNTYRKTIQATQSLRYEDIPADMQNRVRQFLIEKIKGW